MSRFSFGTHALPLLLFACSSSGCVVEQSPPPPPPDTEIGFDPATNFGQACGGQLTNWQVTDRNDSQVETATCGEQIVFGGLEPGVEYTFDILGYSGNQLCWQGACVVQAAQGFLTLGDCHASIQPLCTH